MATKGKKGCGRMYFAGIPVLPDVEFLLEKVEVAIGNRIPYKQIEKLLGVDRKSIRYSTVVARWRKRLEEEFAVALICDEGVAFVVANAPERITVSARHVSKAVRALWRANGIAARTLAADLDDVGKKKRDHLIDMTASLGLNAVRQRQDFIKGLPAISGNVMPLLSMRPQSILPAPSFPESIRVRKAREEAVENDKGKEDR